MAENLHDLARAVSLTVTGDPARPYDQQDDWQRNANGYRVRLRYQRRSMTIDFWQGIAHTSDPDAAGVLDCLLSDADCGARSFDDFCSELGYDVDSRKAYRTWQACQRTDRQLRRFLGDDFDRFLYSERG